MTRSNGCLVAIREALSDDVDLAELAREMMAETGQQMEPKARRHAELYDKSKFYRLTNNVRRRPEYQEKYLVVKSLQQTSLNRNSSSKTYTSELMSQDADQLAWMNVDSQPSVASEWSLN